MICIILRGLPGSGKSTFATMLSELHGNTVKPERIICTADDYFLQNGVYEFDARKLGAAHAECAAKFDTLLAQKEPLVIVANTGVKQRDFTNYITTAKYHGYKVFVMTMNNFHKGESIHNVPLSTLERMEETFEHML